MTFLPRSVFPPSQAAVQNRAGAFTLLELLVSMVLLVVVAGLTFSIVTAIGEAWRSHKARVAAFGDTRAVFETLTQRLSQATLNTYWDYDNRGNPTRYLRRSELHVTLGPTETLLPDVEDTTTDAVFFVAPLGATEAAGNQPLVKLLTACGFYIRFGPLTNRPPFLELLNERVPNRYRYRLYQMLQPGEKLAIYDPASSNDWFRNAVADWSFPLAENVIGLLLQVRYPGLSGEVTAFEYDSRANPGSTPPPTLHQLPPVIRVTLVTMDEESAARLAAQHGVAPPSELLPDTAWFRDVAAFQDDLERWEDRLQRLNIRYQVLSADVALRGAKWSSQ